MAIAVTVPHAAEPGSDQGALVFVDYLQSIMTIRDIEYYTVNGNKPKAMIPLSTYYARGTEYNTELSVALDMSSILIEVQSSGKAYNEWDFVIGELPEYTDEEASSILYNFIDDFFLWSLINHHMVDVHFDNECLIPSMRSHLFRVFI